MVHSEPNRALQFCGKSRAPLYYNILRHSSFSTMARYTRVPTIPTGLGKLRKVSDFIRPIYQNVEFMQRVVEKAMGRVNSLNSARIEPK